MTTEIKLEIRTSRDFENMTRIIDDVHDILKEYFDNNINKEIKEVKVTLHYNYTF